MNGVQLLIEDGINNANVSSEVLSLAGVYGSGEEKLVKRRVHVGGKKFITDWLRQLRLLSNYIRFSARKSEGVFSPARIDFVAILTGNYRTKIFCISKKNEKENIKQNVDMLVENWSTNSYLII